MGSHAKNKAPEEEVVVMMVPFPSHSHLNMLLNLSHLLATSFNIPIHFVGTTTHNQQARLRHHSATTTATTTVTFHDFDVPPVTNPTCFLDFLLPTLHTLHPHVTHLMQELSLHSRRVIVIHDSHVSSIIQDVNTIPNAESYTFHPYFPFFIFFDLWQTRRDELRGLEIEPEVEEVAKYVPNNEWCPSPQFTKYAAEQCKIAEGFESGKVYNTSRMIEGTYVDLLEKLSLPRVPHFAIGPFNPLENIIKEKPTHKHQQHKCLEWLDKQEKESVIFVSFGTTTYMSNEQAREVELGLEKSGFNFMLVLREPDFAESSSDRQPEGLEERGEKRGVVVRGWAPQLDILAHPATGAFMSHCGLGSCMESISTGVPVAGWPNMGDQTKNAVLMAKVLKIGVIVREWEKRDEVVSCDVVENVVRTLLGSDEGKEMRRRAQELRNSLRESQQNGTAEIYSFVSHITRK